MLISQSVVMVARQFQPSTVGEYWLMTNGVATGVYGNKISTDVLSSHSTTRFELTVLPDKASFALKPNADISVALEEIRAFIRKLPDPRYWAVGFNFSYRLTQDGADVKQFSQRFQFQPEISGIHSAATVWGAIALTPGPHGGMIRLHVTPVFPSANPADTPTMLVAEFNVNFHIPDDDHKKALASIDHFEESANHVCDLQSRLVQP